jgi:hypothetical protein
VVYAAIAVCEVAFWAFLGAGLLARYVLRRPRLSVVLLLGSPATDALLLALTAVDVYRGSAPTQAHALAAAYLGFTVAFGPDLVRWADQRFAHRFASGPPPQRPPAHGRAKLAQEWRAFAKACLAWAIAGAVLLALAAVVGDPDRAQPLLGYAGVLTLVLVIWFASGPVPAMFTRRTQTGRGRTLEPTERR